VIPAYGTAATVTTVPVADLLDRDLWTAATEHPFLGAVRDGSLHESAFDTWLVQDHRFVVDLLWFQSRLLARAPDAARAVLAGGLVALVEELAWFATMAKERGLSLAVDRRPAAQAAADLLERLDAAPVQDAFVGLWGIERTYLDAWSFAAPGAEQFREHVTHWTTPEFGVYVAGLGTATDDVIDDPARAARVLAKVATMERAFWDMACAEGRS